MNAFALLLATAAVAYGFAKYFRLPSIPILIGAGMSLSLAGLAPKEIEIGGDGAADWVKAGHHDHAGRVVDDHVYAGRLLERTDVASLTADEPSLHLIRWQGDSGYG